MMFADFRRSIRSKVIGVVLATTLVALVFIGVVLVLYGLRGHRASWEADLATQAQLVGLASAPALAFQDTVAARQNLALLAARPEIVAAALYGRGGSLVATYVRQGESPRSFPPVAEPGHRVRGDLVELFTPVQDADERLGTMYLASRYDVWTPLSAYLLVVLLAIAGSLVIALALSTWLQARITRPIVSIAQAARRVQAERDYGLRVERTTEDETGDLVTAFNEMLQEIGVRARALQATNRALEREMEVRTHAEDALREANRRKDEFIATLAHELRNPLAPIRNAVYLLKLKGPSDPTEERTLELLERQLQHMVRLIDDLMDVSRITRDALELKPSAFRLDEMLEYVRESCEHAVVEGAHELVMRSPRERVALKADRARLAQVLCNLVQNAAKYTPRGGHIEVEASREGRDLMVTVRDTGIGIPPDKLQAVFEPFARLDRSLDKTGGGLGIGLALARRLVQMHGGTLVAESAGPGRGSTFRVCVPAVVDEAELDAPQAEAEAAAPEHGTGSLSRRVLVADDNLDAADTLAMILGRAGYEVETAYDGEHALARAATGSFDIAVLDLGMPRKSGIQVAEQIRAAPWGRAMRLVALTGWGQDHDRARTLAAGFDDHLIKPVTAERLLASLASLSPTPARTR